MYAKVQSDLAAMGLSIGDKTAGKSVEELTEIQNGLIDDLNAKMQAELNELTAATATALDILSAKTTEAQEATLAAMETLFDVVGDAADLTQRAIVESSGLIIDALSQNGALWKKLDSLNINEETRNSKQISSSHKDMMDFATGMYGLMTYGGGTLGFYAAAIRANAFMLNAGLGLQGFKDGGIATGPETGYPVILHGTERITPIGKSDGGFNDPEIKNLLTALVVQGNKRQNVTLTLENGQTLKGYVQVTADELDQARYDRKITNRVYRG
jgi:hypothetical protein